MPSSLLKSCPGFQVRQTPGDPGALAVAAAILPSAAAFQVVDGLQVVGAGILRGMGRTVPPAVFNFIAWWVIALPLGGWFVLRRGGAVSLRYARQVNVGVGRSSTHHDSTSLIIQARELAGQLPTHTRAQLENRV